LFILLFLGAFLLSFERFLCLIGFFCLLVGYLAQLTLNSLHLLLCLHPFSIIDSLFLPDSLLKLIFLLFLLLILLKCPSSKDSLGAEELGYTSILLA
jgi:hypothetical protein